MEYVRDFDTYCSCYTWSGPQSLGRMTGRKRNQGNNGDQPDYIIVDIGCNIHKSLGELGKLAVIQISEKTQQITLVRKTQ